MDVPQGAPMHRRSLPILTALAGAGLLLAPWILSYGTILKLTVLGCAAALLLGLAVLAVKSKLCRCAIAAICGLALVVACWPSRPYAKAELREAYLQRLASYHGTPYVWGGEGRRGIDCSGLPRRALRDAMFDGALRHRDAGMLREFLKQWWFDSSAKALGQGYRGFTQPIRQSDAIARMDASDLLPGDLAVTADGRHVLVFVGEDRWLQADPGIGHVEMMNGSTDWNAWFFQAVTLHRWSVLAGD